MKKSKKLIFYIVFIIIAISCLIFIYPRELQAEYSGIVYRLGDINYSENVKIRINGYLSKGLIKGDKFEGTIYIGDKQLSKIKMRFDNVGRGNIYYFDESIGEYRAYGDMFTKNIKDRFTICVFEKNGQENGSSSWSSKDGLMISVAANNRNEALDISNKLMKDIILNEELK